MMTSRIPEGASKSSFHERMKARLRRRKDAATLIKLASSLSVTDADQPKYLSREISLTGVASEIWFDLGQNLPRKAQKAHMDKLMSECLAGFAELGRAARASLIPKNDTRGIAERDENLAAAGARARRAVEEMDQLASSYAEVAQTGVLLSCRVISRPCLLRLIRHRPCAITTRAVPLAVHGKGVSQLDEAWKRDAIRALVALERAPETLRMEMQRQRLKVLKRELRVLRLDKRRLELLTVADVRAARAARAKAIHPDVLCATAGGRKQIQSMHVGEGLEDTNEVEAQPTRRLFGRILDIFSSRAGEARVDETAKSEEGAMIELNAAFDAVYRAITAS